MIPSLAFVTMLAACGGCADQDAARKSSATASKAGGNAAALERDPAVEEPPPAPIPAAVDRVDDGATAVGIVGLGDQAVLVSKGRQATLRVPAADTRWNGWALERRQGKGIKVVGVTETQWWRPGDFSADASTLADMLAEKGSVDDWVETQPVGTQGAQRIHVNLDGRKERLGISDSAPTSTLFLQPKVPVQGGTTAAARLSRTSGFQKADDGSWAASPPTGAEAVAADTGTAEQTATWTADLADQRGAPVKIAWSQVLDLDRDGAAEAVVCVTGGEADDDCYVYDQIDGERRYHGLTGMRLGAVSPFAFTIEGAPYLAHVPPQPEGSPPRPAMSILRWDGTRYALEGI
ncbi:MAG: hypothetical protein H6742_13210 [Alphaproteobacteria bacterium]|nr:hypothetical protein [Alphaproteobacteria bacterium]